jgi:DNA-binding transcriptional ArsR family regulator
MKASQATRSLGALAQESRLAIFRLLVRRGPQGLSAGEVSSRLGIPGPTLSFHLKALSHAGLLLRRRESRHLYYSADFERMNELVAFLTDQCCSLADPPDDSRGRADCAPVLRRKAGNRQP